MEHTLLNKEEKHFPCNLFGDYSCSVGVGQYAQDSYTPMKRHLHNESAQKVLHYFIPP